MKNVLEIPEQQTPHFTLPRHTITWKQDLTSLKQSFSKEDLEEFLALYSLVESQPKRALKRALLFRQKHPDHPAVLNLLSYLYLVRKNILKGNHLIRENYAKNPDNIFAKINYADLCIRKKRYDEVPKVFNQKFNLPSLYPNKKMFHISEFRGFMTVMGHYYLGCGNPDAAECCLYLLTRVAPKHPANEILKKKIYYKPFYKKLFFK